jgi:hypothetical protein
VSAEGTQPSGQGTTPTAKSRPESRANSEQPPRVLRKTAACRNKDPIGTKATPTHTAPAICEDEDEVLGMLGKSIQSMHEFAKVNKNVHVFLKETLQTTVNTLNRFGRTKKKAKSNSAETISKKKHNEFHLLNNTLADIQRVQQEQHLQLQGQIQEIQIQ